MDDRIQPLISYASSMPYDHIPSPVLEQAQRLFCDTTACIAAGSSADGGKEFLAALAVGLDVANRLGMAFGPFLHTGWLPTTLWGPFGAAVACGRIMHLDEDQMMNAAGLAYSQIHGNRQALVDGSLAKRIQPAFSAQYTAALSLHNGVPRLDDFAADTVRCRTDVLELAKRFSVVEFETDAAAATPVELNIRLRDGRTFTERVEHAKGSPEYPMTDNDMAAKFDDCLNHAAAAYTPSQRENLIDNFMQLGEATDVGPVTTLL